MLAQNSEGPYHNAEKAFGYSENNFSEFVTGRIPAKFLNTKDQKNMMELDSETCIIFFRTYVTFSEF
jgi:hypothetical protein